MAVVVVVVVALFNLFDNFAVVGDLISVPAVEFLKCVRQTINFVALRQKSCH